MGGLFIAVVLAFPRGLAGLMTDQIMPLDSTRLATATAATAAGRAPAPAPAE